MNYDTIKCPVPKTAQPRTTQNKHIYTKRCVSGISHTTCQHCKNVFFGIQYLWSRCKWTQTTDTQATVYHGFNGTQ